MSTLIKLLRSKKTKRQRALSEGGFFTYYRKSKWGSKLYIWRHIRQFGRKRYKIVRGNPK